MSHMHQQSNTKEGPMIASDLPLYPWHKVGADLKGIKYLLVVDYFSRYCTWKYVVKLTSTHSGAVITHWNTMVWYS